MANSQGESQAGAPGRPNHATVVAWLALFVALGGVASGLPGRNAVTSGDIRAGAVRSAEIKTGNVKGVDIRSGAVNTSELLDGGVESQDLAAGGVDSAAIADGGIAPLDLGPAPAARAFAPQQGPACTSQQIESPSPEVLQFSSEVFDTQALHAPPPGDCAASGQSQLVAPIDGIYLAAAQVSWPSNSTNTRTLIITLTESGSPAEVATDVRDALTGGGTQQSLSTIVRMDSGDFVEASVAQDSGATLALTSVFANYLSLAWLGPARLALRDDGDCSLACARRSVRPTCFP